ncbi:hypothetical protein MB46_20025 (plasmid) [Arthrobacter alpinus]|nr:hypothetical protein MB46_20025 [Arthrobacter alpinus]
MPNTFAGSELHRCATIFKRAFGEFVILDPSAKGFHIYTIGGCDIAGGYLPFDPFLQVTDESGEDCAFQGEGFSSN